MNSSTDFCLFGGTALTMNPQGEVIDNAVIEIKAGRIHSITSSANPPSGLKVVDASNCIVLPGFVNGHTHVGMSLLRGVADDLPLQRWLMEKIFPLERKWGNPEFVYWGALLASLEMIHSGTTTFNDMYYFEESAAKAVSEAGMRAICGQTIVDISGVEESQALLGKFEKFLSDVSPYPLVVGAIAPHSIYGVSEKLWPEVIDFAKRKNLLIHVHLAEMQDEMDESQKKYGKTPTQFFDEIGLWKNRAVAAHATCVNETDIEILGRNKVGIAHNPESNLKLGTRICPVVELRKAGAHVCLGTDSTASNNNLDLLQEADTAAKLQTFRKGVGALTAYEVVQMLTIEGAKALGLENKIGSLEVGKSADLIAVDLSAPHANPVYNPYSHLVYGASGQDVKHSIIGGRLVMENRKVLTIDEVAVLKEVRKWGKKIANTN